MICQLRKSQSSDKNFSKYRKLITRVELRMNTVNNLKIDVREHGANEKTLNERLFFQLLAFGDCGNFEAIVKLLDRSKTEAVIYQDINDPKGIAVLVMNKDPDYFVTEWREILNSSEFNKLSSKPELTMLGRTYSSGFEPDLENWLIHKPRHSALNPEWPWCIWYPLRRTGEFSKLSRKDQGSILREHAVIGRAYGESDLAHDIRLACHGLDKNDNDFVIGLVGRDLHPLSHIVQTMRKTSQTSKYIQTLGPFFVGKAFWQSPLKTG